MTPATVTIINIGTLSMNKFWGETERVHAPSATCTLIETDGCRLLVDPSPDPDELEPLLFARAGIRPGRVDRIFLTHFHGDHRFGLALFPSATWLMAPAGLEEWRNLAPNEADLLDRFLCSEGQMPKGVETIPTPGHTAAHHSLRVASEWGNLLVAGDAVMTPDFFKAKEGFHNSVDFDQARVTIGMIEKTTGFVIPGHGNLFPVGNGR